MSECALPKCHKPVMAHRSGSKPKYCSPEHGAIARMRKKRNLDRVNAYSPETRLGRLRSQLEQLESRPHNETKPDWGEGKTYYEVERDSLLERIGNVQEIIDRVKAGKPAYEVQQQPVEPPRDPSWTRATARIQTGPYAGRYPLVCGVCGSTKLLDYVVIKDPDEQPTNPYRCWDHTKEEIAVGDTTSEPVGPVHRETVDASRDAQVGSASDG